MKNANKELKASVKEIDLDAIEDLHDDMTEMLETTDEIQDIMGRSYDTNAVDEDELLAELDGMEDTIDVRTVHTATITTASSHALHCC
jgi:charged multivesicular body protein 5